MVEPTRIGFSTTDALVSRLIRWFTRSEVSHAFLVYHDVDFGRDMVMEAVGAGFRIVPLDKWKLHNRLVDLIEPRYSIDEGLNAAVDWLGEAYDKGAIAGMALRILGRSLRLRLGHRGNLLASSRTLFCSEAVARACRAARYPGFRRDPETVSPQDLYVFFRKERKQAPGQPAVAAAP